MFILFDPYRAAVAMAQPSQLPGRLSAILDDRRSRARTTRPAMLSLSLATLVALIPLAAARVGAKLPKIPSDDRNAFVAETAPPSRWGIGSLASETLPHATSVFRGRPESDLRPRVTPSDLPTTETSEASFSALSDISWGEAKDGLQMGLRLENPRRRFTIGEQISFSVFLRNTTKHDIAFAYTWNAYDDQPRVEDTRGTVHEIIHANPLGLPSAIGVILKSGESLKGYETGIALGNTRDQAPSPFSLLDRPAPGIYHLRQGYRYKLLTTKDVQDLLKRCDQKGSLVYAYPLELFTKNGKTYKGRGALTGADGFGLYKRNAPEEGVWSKTVDFEIVAKGAPDTLLAGNRVTEQQVSGIAWGKATGGLQTGIGFVAKRSRYHLGEVMEVNVYIRNAGSKPTTFSWQSAPQFDHSTLLMPTLTGPTGKETLFSGGEPIQKPSRSKTLQPDEMTLLSHSLIQLEPNEGNNPGFGLGPVAILAPGEYRLAQPTAIKPEGRDGKELILTSGDLEFEAVSSVNRASWGKTVDGLQAGLSFVGERSRFRIGEMVQMDLFWRNASDHDLSVTYALFYAYDYVPTVFNAKGDHMPLHQVAPMLLPVKKSRTLKPGETVRIGSVNCLLASDTKQGKQVGMFPTLEATPGKYRISQYTILQPGENGPREGVHGIIEINRAPVSGELEFEVVPN